MGGLSFQDTGIESGYIAGNWRKVGVDSKTQRSRRELRYTETVYTAKELEKQLIRCSPTLSAYRLEKKREELDYEFHSSRLFPFVFLSINDFGWGEAQLQ